MNSDSEILAILKDQHFSSTFIVGKDKMLHCRETGETFLPDEVVIEKVYRYEGDSNPDDTSVIYAMKAKSGTLGVLIDAYGIYADQEITDFVKLVPRTKEIELQSTGT